MKLLWKKLLLRKFLLLKIVKYWNNKLAIWSHWSLHCYKQHLDQSAGNFESRKVFYGCAVIVVVVDVVIVVVIKFCASKSISNSGMQFYFTSFSFRVFFYFVYLCLCSSVRLSCCSLLAFIPCYYSLFTFVSPHNCLVALYLLIPCSYSLFTFCFFSSLETKWRSLLANWCILTKTVAKFCCPICLSNDFSNFKLCLKYFCNVR